MRICTATRMVSPTGSNDNVAAGEPRSWWSEVYQAYHEVSTTLRQVDTSGVEVCALVDCFEEHAGGQDHRGLGQGQYRGDRGASSIEDNLPQHMRPVSWRLTTTR